MSTRKKTRPISVEEYLEGEKYADIKHELVAGEVYAMVGASEAHNLISGAFYMALRRHLRGTLCRVFMTAMNLRIGNNFYYPDVFVTSSPADNERYFKTLPSLIVEVLSPATAVRDTRDKLTVYQGIDSLREYVLAEQERREVRVYRRTGPAWDLVTVAGNASIALTSVELSVSLDEIYGDVLP